MDPAKYLYTDNADNHWHTCFMLFYILLMSFSNLKLFLSFSILSDTIVQFYVTEAILG